MAEKDHTTKINERLRGAFGEVTYKARTLLVDALDQHKEAILGVFLRDREVGVSFGLAIKLNEGGLIEVDLSTGYVKERVKEKTSARVTPGQEKLPGMGDEKHEAPCQKSVVKAAASRLKKLEKEAAVPRTCKTCANNSPLHGCDVEACEDQSHWAAKG